MKKLSKFIISAIFISLVITSPAQANMGVPMIFITFPGMLLALLPIIAIESKIHFRFFGLDKIKVIKYTALSNSASTFIGIPIAWLVHTALFLVLSYYYSELSPDSNLYSFNAISVFLQLTIGAAWLGPINEQLSWMVPAACLFLLVPYFFASWYVEYLIMRKLIKNVEKQLCKSATLKANLVSYTFLMIVVIVWFVTSILNSNFTSIA